MSLLILTLLLNGWSISSSAQTRHFGASMDSADWHVQGGLLICRLVQGIPSFGEAAFERKAGHAPRFRLENWQHPLRRAQKGLLLSYPPPWRTGEKPQRLAKVSVLPGKYPVTLKTNLSERLLGVLSSGRFPVFVYPMDNGSKNNIMISLSAVKFSEAYAQYLGCLQHLLPYSYEQMANNTIYFANNSSELSKTARFNLSKVKAFLQAGGEYHKFMVDAYTDNVGSRDYNIYLARKRALAVRQYLIDKVNIPADKIEMRAYGKADPKVKNDSEKAKAQNRRVLVRLVPAVDASESKPKPKPDSASSSSSFTGANVE